TPNQTMKKAGLILILSLTLFSATQVSAAPRCDNSISATLCNPVDFYKDDIKSFLENRTAVASTFFAGFALMFVVYSGFRMIISQGDSEKLEEAKRALTWSIYGLILSMFAFVLITAIGTYIK